MKKKPVLFKRPNVKTVFDSLSVVLAVSFCFFFRGSVIEESVAQKTEDMLGGFSE